jgi:transcriptional regulator with XRE-family HTH domain
MIKNLKVFRVTNNVTQAQLSRLAELHQSELSKIENNREKLTKEKAKLLIKAYKTLGIDATNVITDHITISENRNA